jgi:phosphoribosylanthranilate isomerase
MRQSTGDCHAAKRALAVRNDTAYKKIMTKIKICGITDLNDALAAADAGADLLGFNFYPKSPRFLEPDACHKITFTLRKNFPHLTLVGVFVNAPVSEIRSILETCSLHLAQLHGDEPPEILAELNGQAFKAIRLSVSESAPAFDFQQAEKNRETFIALRNRPSPALLVDAAVKGLYGGSGKVADWLAAAELSKRVPLLLAGGLTPENVAEAVRQVQPWGVDVASGVETSPGVKDFGKMKAFVAEVQRVEKRD